MLCILLHPYLPGRRQLPGQFSFRAGQVGRVGGPVGKQKVWALPYQRLAEHPGETDSPLKVFQPFQWNREVSFRVFMRGHCTPSCQWDVLSHAFLSALPCSIHYGESQQHLGYRGGCISQLSLSHTIGANPCSPNLSVYNNKGLLLTLSDSHLLQLSSVMAPNCRSSLSMGHAGLWYRERANRWCLKAYWDVQLMFHWPKQVMWPIPSHLHVTWAKNV